MALVISNPPTQTEITPGQTLTPNWLSWFATYFGAASWQTFTPALTPGGAMTAAGLSGSMTWLRIGAIVFYSLSVSFTLGGTASTTLDFSLPVALAGGIVFPGAVNVLNNGVWALGTLSLGFPNSGLLQVTLNPQGTNFTLGATSVQASGFFRCA